jgi:hypothetical protein
MIFKTNVQRILGTTILGAISSIFILSQKCPQYYNLLFLIPLTYAVINIIFGFMHSNSNTFNVFGIMFNGIMLLRTVIMPVLLAAGGYATSKTVNIDTNMPLAILLFCYEIIFEHIVVFFFLNKNPLSIKKTEETSIKMSNKYYKIVILLAIGLIFCFVLAPMSVGYYRTVFGINDYEFTGFDSRNLIMQYATSLPRKFGLVTFRYFANVSRLVIPAIILIEMKKRNVSKPIVRIVTISCIFIANFLLMDDTIATSLVNSLIMLLFYNKLFSSPKKIIKYFIFALSGVMAYFALRISLTSTMANNIGVSTTTRISNIFQAYFCGITNIAAGLNLHTTSFMETYKYAIYEILKGIPYASTIFRLDSTNISNLFNAVNHCTGQIVPAISSGTLYFGWIFAPILCCIFIYISLKSAKNIQNNKKPLNILGSIAISVYALMGISMYSIEATCSFIFCIGIPIKVLSILFEK